LSTPVYGVAIGIPLNKASTGPFAQFQNCDDNEESLTKLVMQLVRQIPGSDPDHDAIHMQAVSFRDRANKVLEGYSEPLSVKETDSQIGDPSVAKLFEEIKVMFQDLPSRIDSRVSETPARSRRRRRIDPRMIMYIMDRFAEERLDPIPLMILASMFRDDVPWVYETSMSVARAIQSGDSVSIDAALRRLVRAIEVTSRLPFLEDIGIARDMQSILMEMPMLIDRLMRRYSSQSERDIIVGKSGKKDEPE
jgi:hypothetical protein